MSRFYILANYIIKYNNIIMFMQYRFLSNKTQWNNTNNNNTTNNTTNNTNNLVLTNNRNRQLQLLQQPPPPKPVQTHFQSIQMNPRSEQKMKWGEPVWFLFHTLAHKVKAEEFANIRIELIGHIVSICQNLPCPSCSSHATEYMKRVNFGIIATKEDLKRFLFDFHNKVNKDKSYPVFEFDKLDEKYETANTINIIYNFFNHYNNKQFNVNMITANMHRERIITYLKKWLNDNITKFDV